MASGSARPERHPYLAGAATPRVLAHRGLVTPELSARGVAENTLAALAAAVEAGTDYLETDCHLTSDGRIVLFHDADLARVLGDPRAVAAVPHRELAALMASRGGLLTLEEAFEAFPRARFNIDVKAAAVAEPLGRAVAPHAERVLVTSFSERLRVRAIAAAARAGGRPATSPGRGALIRLLLAVNARSRRGAARALAAYDALQIPERQGRVPVLGPRLIDEAHRAGVEVHVWTVNDPARMAELVALGVDGVVTDRADAALAALRPD